MTRAKVRSSHAQRSPRGRHALPRERRSAKAWLRHALHRQSTAPAALTLLVLVGVAAAIITNTVHGNGQEPRAGGLGTDSPAAHPAASRSHATMPPPAAQAAAKSRSTRQAASRQRATRTPVAALTPAPSSSSPQRPTASPSPSSSPTPFPPLPTVTPPHH